LFAKNNNAHTILLCIKMFYSVTRSRPRVTKCNACIRRHYRIQRFLRYAAKQKPFSSLRSRIIRSAWVEHASYFCNFVTSGL